MSKFDIFISYSRKDSVIADKICNALDEANISYFIDRQGIGGGMEFPAVLANTICESKLFLFLASENSYQSKFTNNEIIFAFNEKPKQSILPYIIDSSELPIHIRFVFAGINWRNLKEHPIQTALISDIAKLLSKEKIYQSSGYSSNVRIITPKQVDLIGNIVTQLNPLSNIINGVSFAKKHYSSIIQIKTYQHVPNIGIAIIGQVLYGCITPNGNYLLRIPNRAGIEAKTVLIHNITNNPIYSDFIIQTMKKYSSYESDYDLYLSLLFRSGTNMINSISSNARSGDIVGVILSGITLKYMGNCTHLYKLA